MAESEATLISPAPWSRIQAALARRVSSPRKDSSTSLRNNRASGVGTSRLWIRAKSENRTELSSWAMARLTAGWLIPRSSAAWDAVPARMTVANISIWR